MSKLAALQNSCSGPVFVFASGPSAKDFPLADYQHYPFIVVNGAVRRFLEQGLTPLAFVFDDINFLTANKALVLQAIRSATHSFMPEEHFLAGGLSEQLAPSDREKIVFIDKVNKDKGTPLGSYRYYFIKNICNKDLVFNLSRLLYTSKNIGFSKNMLHGYFCARTIPYVALQLAYFLGFTRVFFVGMDLNGTTGRFYDDLNPLPTTLDKDFPKHIEPSFRLFSQRVMGRAFMAYNLATDSKLSTEIVPKITLDQLQSMLND